MEPGDRLKMRVSGVHRVVPTLRVLMAWLILFAFVAQTQIAGGHVHPPKTSNEPASFAPAHDGNVPGDPRSDSQCVFCQQVTSGHPFVASGSPELQLPPTVPAVRVALAAPSQSGRLASFGWQSRAPPAA